MDPIDELRDAAAMGRLLVVTGAGVSLGMVRPDGRSLPRWGELVQALRAKADTTRIAPDRLRLLDDLLPASAIEKVHGDALIEASEILQAGFDARAFGEAISELCSERPGEMSDTHAAIAELSPFGVITFNYDRGHETAFRRAGIGCQSLVYDDSEGLKRILARRENGKPFVLKAHGCVRRPRSLVLTSSSYRNVLSGNRAYRAFLHHALIHYTVLIVGFGMRDRDFDQLLSTIEVELGAPIHSHAFIVREPDATDDGLMKRAEWAAISARFGVKPIYVPEYADIPTFIRQLARETGPKVQQLMSESLTSDSERRSVAHDGLRALGAVGRRQVRVQVGARLSGAALTSLERSECIYILGEVSEKRSELASKLVDEVLRATRMWSAHADVGEIECVAHALVSLRRCLVQNGRARARLRVTLDDASVKTALMGMDRWLTDNGGVPRLAVYAAAASAEMEARAR